MSPIVRRYLEHAGCLEDQTPHASVELEMHGEIRLKGRWAPFRAKQWLDPRRGFRWDAKLRMGLLPIKGFDRYREGQGEMSWRIAGLIPLVRASGTDISKSARGRCVTEAIWSPGSLHPERGVDWSEAADGWLQAKWQLDGFTSEIGIETGSKGQVLKVRSVRWGNPDGAGWREIPFGGITGAERTFEGITIPSEISVGWWFGSDRFEEEGEFIRVRVDAWKPSAK